MQAGEHNQNTEATEEGRLDTSAPEQSHQQPAPEQPATLAQKFAALTGRDNLTRRIVFIFLVLALFVQSAAYLALRAHARYAASKEIQVQLNVAQRVFQNDLAHNADRLEALSKLITVESEFGHLAAAPLGSNQAAQALRAYLQNRQTQTQLDDIAVVTLDGIVLTSASHLLIPETAFAPVGHMQAAQPNFVSKGLYKLADGTVLQFAASPTSYDTLGAMLVVVQKVEARLLSRLVNSTRMQLTLLQQREGVWSILASTLPEAKVSHLRAQLQNSTGKDALVHDTRTGHELVHQLFKVTDTAAGPLHGVLSGDVDQEIAAVGVVDAMLIALLLLSLLLFGLSAWWLARRITRPINQLNVVAQAVAHGQYTQEAQVLSHDEIGQLATSLNTMRHNLMSREARIIELGFKDNLTGLDNRASLAHSWPVEPDKTCEPQALVLIDVDRFRSINANLGYLTGDHVLKAVGQLLTDMAGAHRGQVGRVGTDIFAVSLPQPRAGYALGFARSVQGFLESPLIVGEHLLDISVTIGIAQAPQDAAIFNDVFRAAETALDFAHQNRVPVVVFDSSMLVRVPENVNLLGQLRRAIAGQEGHKLVLMYQPKVKLSTRDLVGAEALVRWHHPERGLVGPEEFVGFAERTGLIRSLTARVMELAFMQLSDWLKQGIAVDLSVNLSAQDLTNPDLPGIVRALITRTGAPAQLITLEITETGFINDPGQALENLMQLRWLGVKLSIDDFGTGYSSLSYLQQLPVNEIKIDRSFVQQMSREQSMSGPSSTIVRTMIELGHQLGHRIVAEGVTEKKAEQRLRTMGCDLGQGFLYSKPVPAQELAKHVLSQSPMTASTYEGGASDPTLQDLSPPPTIQLH